MGKGFLLGNAAMSTDAARRIARYWATARDRSLQDVIERGGSCSGGRLSHAMAFSQQQLLVFMRQEAYAVQASVSVEGAPQAALVGVIVTDRFEVFFDTLVTSRKAANLRHDPAAALVMGPTDAASVRTVQYEGVADVPTGDDLERLLELYFAQFPDGRIRRNLPDITYVRVKPTWIRYSDYSVEPPEIVEFAREDLG